MQNLERILKKLDKKPEGRGILNQILKELEVDFNDSSLVFYRDYLIANKLAIATTNQSGIELTITSEGRAWINEVRNNSQKLRDKFRDEVDLERTKYEIDQLWDELKNNKKKIQGFAQLERFYISRAHDHKLMMWISLGMSILALILSFISLVK